MLKTSSSDTIWCKRYSLLLNYSQNTHTSKDSLLANLNSNTIPRLQQTSFFIQFNKQNKSANKYTILAYNGLSPKFPLPCMLAQPYSCFLFHSCTVLLHQKPSLLDTIPLFTGWVFFNPSHALSLVTFYLLLASYTLYIFFFFDPNYTVFPFY